MFPHRGAISIQIGPSSDSIELSDPEQTSDWKTALKLRDYAREFILRRCGEPDLGQE